MVRTTTVIGILTGLLLIGAVQARPIPADDGAAKPPAVKPVKHESKQKPARWPHLRLVMEPPKIVFTKEAVEQAERPLSLSPRWVKILPPSAFRNCCN